MVEQRIFFLGIDCGGTGCRARLVDDAGRVLGSGVSGAASLRAGADAAWAASMSAAADAIGQGDCAGSGDRIHVGIGLAGWSREGERQALLQKSHVFASLSVTSDASIACLGAHGGADGGVIIAGTGAIGFGRIDGRDVRIGGYGFPVSDAGSGADIGLEAIRLALRAHDGLMPGSPLLTHVWQKFGGDSGLLVEWMDTATATDYAALAPIVLEFANDGDDAGSALAAAAAQELARVADALTARGIGRIALMGSVAQALESRLSQDLRSRLVPATGDAIDGALALARSAAGRAS